MLTELLPLAVAIAVLSLCSAVHITLPDGREIVSVAAVAPAVVALGPHGFDVAATRHLVVVIVVSEAVALVSRRGEWRRVLWHLAVFVVSFGIFGIAAGVVGRATLEPPSAIGMMVVSLIAFLFVMVTLPPRERPEYFGGANLRGLLRSVGPVAAVLISIANVIVLVFPTLGWAAFSVLVIPLLGTKWEYGRFREAKQTYEETVRALGRLTERAGYVPHGHHENVADIAVSLGRDVGLAEERVNQLRLVALMHEAGAVSLPAPDVGRDHTEATRRILQETGYLATFAKHLPSGNEDEALDSLEAQVLFAADRVEAILRGEDDGDAVLIARRAPDVAAAVRQLLTTTERPR